MQNKPGDYLVDIVFVHVFLRSSKTNNGWRVFFSIHAPLRVSISRVSFHSKKHLPYPKPFATFWPPHGEIPTMDCKVSCGLNTRHHFPPTNHPAAPVGNEDFYLESATTWWCEKVCPFSRFLVLACPRNRISGWFHPNFSPLKSGWNNPLILTTAPNFQREIQVVDLFGNWPTSETPSNSRLPRQKHPFLDLWTTTTQKLNVCQR